MRTVPSVRRIGTDAPSTKKLGWFVSGVHGDGGIFELAVFAWASVRLGLSRSLSVCVLKNSDGMRNRLQALCGDQLRPRQHDDGYNSKQVQ